METMAMSVLMEFRHLKYIVAVAEIANFTRAAERLFLAQPSLSKQIKEFEDGIGIQIFLRNRDRVYITPGGQMIVSYAQEALRARDEIIKAARAVHLGEIPVLRIGFSCFIHPEILQPFRETYARLFPECPMQLSGGDPSQILCRMEERVLDGALLPMPVNDDHWVVEQVASAPLVVCMRADDPLTQRTEIEPSELSRNLKIFRDPETHPAAHCRLMEMLAEIEIQPAVSCLAATPADIQWMVQSGCGLALIDQKTALESTLTTRPVAGVVWTADTAVNNKVKAGQCFRGKVGQ